jgi:hypothetical protein
MHSAPAARAILSMPTHSVCPLLVPLAPVPSRHSPADFRALFIRAPAVLQLGPGVEALASYTLSPEEQAQQVGHTNRGRAVIHGRFSSTHEEWPFLTLPCMLFAERDEQRSRRCQVCRAASHCLPPGADH